MKKIFKKEVIIAFIIGIILASSIAVYAYSYAAKDVSYTKPGTTTSINVETALNELYSKGNKTPQQVATITTNDRTATYTMQNDGYILGTAGTKTDDGTGANINFTKNETTNIVFTTDYRNSNLYTVSLYVTKGTTISVRNDGGIYNLTVYEWK